MKWSNLKHWLCPKCGERLEADEGYNTCPECDFKIGNERLRELVDDLRAKEVSNW